MEKMEVEKQVREFIAAKLNKNINTVTVEKRFIEDLRVDSLDIVDMLYALEEEYGIHIPDEEVPDFKTIGGVVDFVYNAKK
jgi:acyl carrier protein